MRRSQSVRAGGRAQGNHGLALDGSVVPGGQFSSLTHFFAIGARRALTACASLEQPLDGTQSLISQSIALTRLLRAASLVRLNRVLRLAR